MEVTVCDLQARTKTGSLPGGKWQVASRGGELDPGSSPGMTENLKQNVSRNRERFPEDFMFPLTWEEARETGRKLASTPWDSKGSLRSQSVTLKRGAHMKYRPYAFTEQGVAMLSSVLRSKRAVRVNIEIMRAFVRLRNMLAALADLKSKLEELEDKVATHDDAIRSLVVAIRNLIEGPRRKDTRKIGFLPGGK
jgi:hypothetical protein